MERQLRGGKITRGKPDGDSGSHDSGGSDERSITEMVKNTQRGGDLDEHGLLREDWDQSKFCNNVCEAVWNSESAGEFRVWDPCPLCPILCEESER